MAEKLKLTRPNLVAVWPGMGNVALNAGIYLLAKLDMSVIAELDAGELFDVDAVEVKNGIIQPGRRPGNRFFLWMDPKGQSDLVVFLGEAQPPIGKYRFCRQLINYAKLLNVQHITTFAAMATRMHPERNSRVFAAATDAGSLEPLRQRELEIIDEGQISGLNGVLLGAAAEEGLHGSCFLGEIPQIFSQLPFPKASMAILEVFASIHNIDLDFTELADQAKAMDEQLGEILSRVEEKFGEQYEPEEEPGGPELASEPEISDETRQRIEQLFEQAARNRAKAVELKHELDRSGIFKEYEDRFLDLFKKPE